MSRPPFEVGVEHYALDRMENAPFASIGGLAQRHDPQIPEGRDAEWLRGYLAEAERDLGPDWRTARFGWAPVLTIDHHRKE